MKTEIAPHIRKTIQEITVDINQLGQDRQRLVDMRQGLMDLYAGDNELENIIGEPETPPGKSPQRRPRQVPAAAAAGTETNGQEKTGRWSAEGVAILAHVRKMPEPISGTTLAVAAGIDIKKASNYIARFAAKGWLKKTGRGEYNRTTDLPETI